MTPLKAYFGRQRNSPSENEIIHPRKRLKLLGTISTIALILLTDSTNNVLLAEEVCKTLSDGTKLTCMDGYHCVPGGNSGNSFDCAEKSFHQSTAQSTRISRSSVRQHSQPATAPNDDLDNIIYGTVRPFSQPEIRNLHNSGVPMPQAHSTVLAQIDREQSILKDSQSTKTPGCLSDSTCSSIKRLVERVKTGDQKAKKELKGIYERLKEEYYFSQSEKYKADKLAKLIANDKEIKFAKANWGSLTEEEREGVAQKVANYHAMVFGIKPKELTFEDLSAKGWEGYYNGEKVVLNNSSHFTSFNNIVDTVVHENTHRYQTELVNALESGRPLGDRYNEAMIMYLNNELYFSTDSESYDTYRDQPKEAQAWKIGAIALKYVSPVSYLGKEIDNQIWEHVMMNVFKRGVLA